MTAEGKGGSKRPLLSFRTARITASATLLLSVLAAALRWAVFAANDLISRTLLALTFAGFGAWFIITIVWCRCPHCGHRIIQKVWIISECPACKGLLLEDRISKGD